MNCKQLESNLLLLFDGRGSAEQRAEAERHLLACAACRARAEELRGVWTALDDAPAHEVSAAFDARLRERMAAEDARRWFDALIPQPRLALALALLLALAVWIGTLPTNNSELAQSPRSEEEFKMIENLQVLEDLDVLANFEVLSSPPPKQNSDAKKL
ncbi:MAG TPA: hypothetical protein VNL38_01835 [Candidatus Nitrosotenuis sp.]|nr:hypothetical protein [Candidatus Nitrosotenuis sp.]